MTEQEREELIEKMAKAAWESDGVLNWEGVEFGRKIYLLEARAALAVAEPVIREQADNALREENARLRAVIQFILDNQISERRSEHIDCVIIHGEPIRAARAAILGKVKAEAACPAPDEAP